uniref:Uncharacterized protein n=1 Tax=viral metagenome TaxID=1070528 RepID=A0A6C0KR55_9ZZZZ
MESKEQIEDVGEDVGEDREQDREQEKKGKKKAKKDPNASCRIPNLRTSPRSTRWARHVHTIVKTFAPALLENKDVIAAFNQFVDTLAKYDTIIETYLPGRSNRYELYENIVLQEYTYPHDYAPIRFFSGPTAEERKKITNDIKEAYTVLYNHIKNDVVPPLRHTLHRERVQKMTPLIQRDIEMLKERIEVEKVNHERMLKTLQNSISAKIEQLRILVEQP